MSNPTSRHYRWVPLAAILLTLLSLTGSAAAQPVTINPDTATYDFHPSTTTMESGATWYAWHGYRNGRDQIFARRVGADGAIGPLHNVSEQGTVHGPPTILGEGQSVSVVWSMKKKERWQVVIRTWRDGKWGQSIGVSSEAGDAIYPAAIALPDERIVAAWSEHVAGQWRVRGCRVESGKPSPVFDISAEAVNAFRPALVAHGDDVWCFWDQYRRPNYSVQGRIMFPGRLPIEQVSPPDEYCLTPTALSHESGLHVAWLRKVDVIGRPGVISQWHTLHAAVRGNDGWRQITTPDGNATAAELTQGLMAKIEPRPVATGGYLGPRTRPSLLADDDRVWLLWERKSDHRGSTPKVSGDLVGRPSRNGMWQTPVVLQQGRVDYHLIHPPVARSSQDGGKVRLLASPLPRRGLRTYQALTISLADGKPFEQDEWTGWNPVTLPIESETAPRREITANGKTYQLLWADLHCHNGLTADAEGEPDEMHFYARDRASLDVVVFTNNDFYNVPLTQYDFEVGNLFARTSSAPTATNQRELLSLPGFEWTSRIPGAAAAKLSDPGNWLPPYRNRSYPNHRSVIYPPSGGPLVHFTEVGNDIARLNAAVEQAGGITLSQHNAFKLSGHPVEVGLELTSGWSNYIAQRPKLFHDPLNNGARLGFTANGDTHRRAPGLSGALTGIYAEELTAESVLDALRKRRCFATMGSQIFLDTRAGNAMMGGAAAASDGSITLTLHAIGTRSVTKATLVRNGEAIHEVTGNGSRELKAEYKDEDLPVGTHWYYWRVSQSGVGSVLPGNLMPAHGYLAWSSPSWVAVR